MLPLVTSEKTPFNPYRTARKYGKPLVPIGLPLLTLAWLWHKAIALGGFEDDMTGAPAMIAAIAVIGSVFALIALLVWISPLIFKAYDGFTDWWKRQEAKYDRIED